MSRKITALERSRAGANSQAFTFDWRIVAYPLALVLGALGVVWSLYQLAGHWWYERSASALADVARRTSEQIEQRFRQVGSQIEQAARTDAALAAVKDRSEGALATGALTLRQLLADAELVRLVGPDIELLEPEPYPGLGYASLFLLLQAKDSGLLSGPAPGKDRLIWAAPVTEPITASHRVLRGLLVVSYPLTEFRDVVADTNVGRGYLDLRTYSQRGSELITAASGFLPERVELIEVPGSKFSIAYDYPPLPAQNSWPWWLNLIALLASGVLRVVAHRERYAAAPAAERTVDELAAAAAAAAPVDADLESAMAFARGDGKTPATAQVVVPASIFRAYDIRGVVGKTLTPQIAEVIGRAIGSEALDRGRQQLVVGRDGRLSGPEICEGLITGLCATGVDVIDIGAVPTGVLYYATHSLGTGSGVMVTGSHNPADYNGFKIVLGDETLAGDAVAALHQRIVEQQFHSGEGGVQELDVLDDYVERIASDVQVEEMLKVVVDCGNGIAGKVTPLVLEEIGCEVVPLFCDVDGSFPNHHPDPSDPDNLRDLIVAVDKLEADVGVALDGDGDRLGVVTRGGEIIYPDRLLMLFAQDVLTRNPGAAVIYDVKCTGHLARIVLNHGGSPIMWKTGHSFIKAKMKETNAALAGEMSGHFFFKERWFGFDDATYACARLLEILASEPAGASAALEALPNSVSTPEIKVEMSEDDPHAFVDAFAEQAQFEGARITTIDGIRADYSDGWGLVRCSNTTPCLVLRFDADSSEALERIQAAFKTQLKALKPDLELPF